jgi:hypothetical protein
VCHSVGMSVEDFSASAGATFEIGDFFGKSRCTGGEDSGRRARSLTRVSGKDARANSAHAY